MTEARKENAERDQRFGAGLQLGLVILLIGTEMKRLCKLIDDREGRVRASP